MLGAPAGIAIARQLRRCVTSYGSQAADEAAEVAVAARPEHEVPVVGHQAPGERPHRGAGALLGQQFRELSVLGLVVEQGGPGIGPVEHMVDETTGVGGGIRGMGCKVTEEAEA